MIAKRFRTRSAAGAATLLLAASLGIPARAALTRPARITFGPAGVLVVDGQKKFPLTLTIVPGPDARAPNGRPAYAEFADSGVLFMRSGGPAWNDDTISREHAMQAAAAASGLRCCPWLGWDLSNFSPGDANREARLRTVIAAFKDSPGMGLWKGADEPDWSNAHNPAQATPEQVAHVARLLRELDPAHPIWLVQAPRGTAASLRRYDAGWDVGGMDIYPVSYPPGVHTEGKNKELSMVGDFTRLMKRVAGEKPFWMTLQIAFSGVVKPGRTLRFPTFPEQRFMAYEAIINGARGLTYFGGGLPQTLNSRDQPLGFNWTYFDRVMRPLFAELGPRSPLLPALLAPDAGLKLSVAPEAPPRRALARKEEEQNLPAPSPPRLVRDEAGADARAIECLVRQAGDDYYVLACKKEGPTVHVRFRGLPPEIHGAGAGAVLFEEPRKVDAQHGSFADWFGPFEVHVYHFAASRKAGRDGEAAPAGPEPLPSAPESHPPRL
ncbi:MAG TPA: hypothetical protein P5037_10620 [Candidatus Paceibacterota bacterium]|nr:hypothetical protein [Verrucomicrobiota bacterium]HRY59290.1 hypothetical protein [Candidatus Paceibacterota bacterium]HOW78868.1 hypothetical protein [Verrucomicrobiota bacterium]HQE90181.1 hypothetical protein [Verrucomicrobiota bacterium]HQH02735.1 hypothetical protein [Verrucomicrobiota bacterium]